MDYTNEQIDKEIKRLHELKASINAKTMDGVEIKRNNTYYALVNLSRGFDEITIDDKWDIELHGIKFNKSNKELIINFANYYNYFQLYSTKELAYEKMFRYLHFKIETAKNEIRIREKSLKQLEKLKNNI